MKKGIVFILVISFLALLVACGGKEEVQNNPINNSETKNSESNEQGSNNTGVVTEDLSGILTEITSDKDEKTFLYEVRNNTNTNIEIPFSENGSICYIVRDEEGKEISKQLATHEIEANQVISAGESISASIILHGYDAGTYVLEAWLKSDLENTYIQTILFTVE
jgi:hypothetical protein